MTVSDLIESLSTPARGAPESGIVDVFRYGMGRPEVMALWAGEGDQPTPEFICEAAERSLRDGETFYTHQRGLPELRAAIAAYHEHHFGVDLPMERVVVTGSGMQSIQIAMRAVAGAGQSVLVPSPAWPNAAAAAGLSGAAVRFVPMTYRPTGWDLDLDQLFSAVDETTSAIFINSPCNPTGWVMTRDEASAILDFSRERGLWIVADEIYARYFYGDGMRAPSFFDVSDPEDRIVFVNTMSKNWAMTGWRVGWAIYPEALSQTFENLVQYSTSGVAAFMQRAAIVAIEKGEDFVESQIAQARTNRDLITTRLGTDSRLDMARLEGAFYAFFSIKGVDDTRHLGRQLIDEAHIGLAPGTAFGPGGERFMRLCFARKTSDIDDACNHLLGWLDRRV
ncbi:MAG: pyridoxal phosphate-dependent aminotransferase [Pseudomonadota bacterium]